MTTHAIGHPPGGQHGSSCTMPTSSTSTTTPLDTDEGKTWASEASGLAALHQAMGWRGLLLLQRLLLRPRSLAYPEDATEDVRDVSATPSPCVFYLQQPQLLAIRHRQANNAGGHGSCSIYNNHHHYSVDCIENYNTSTDHVNI